MNITFTKVYDISEDYAPVPASKSVPDWYKTLDSYTLGKKSTTGKGDTSGTIKRCMPVFDVLTAGYIIPTYVDVWITKKITEEGILDTWYEWPTLEPVAWHVIEQAPNHPQRNGTRRLYPKWINAWSIKTPPGYSCLFIPPVHRESVFTVMPGIVDTDRYISPVNFPFVFNDPDFEGLIPAGTPMVQVIPFKRDSFEMTFGDEKIFEEHTKTHKKLRSKIFDGYKTLFRSEHSYK